MSDFLFIDAVSCLEPELIENHIAEKAERRRAQLIRKRARALKIAAFAAGFTIMIASTLTLRYVFHMQVGGVEIQSTAKYNILAVVIGGVVSVIAAAILWKIGCYYIKKRYRQ